MIVAHFYDVESGRLDLQARGQGHAHEAFDIPIARDGGIQDLLAESRRPDRRFAAVICESVERVARRTYFGTKIEYELEQAGVMLLAADEPMPALDRPSGGRARKRATSTLTRRVKQAVAEWYVLQLLELSWDGFCEHTEQGWNVGKPCYGYRAKKIPRPVAARRAEGRTKSRLVPHPVEGPAVTRIFALRSVHRLSYDDIADQLNTDLTLNPPPVPVDPRRAVGRWTCSAVREILTNAKYTGYMVWNRRASKKGGKVNPPSEWVWSPHPTHEPLVTKDQFQQVFPVGRTREGSRSKPGRNKHPQAYRIYPLRAYVICDQCGRRMHGKTRHGTPYYACEPDPRQHADRRDWYARHPKSMWVRQDQLLDEIGEVINSHVTGPYRQTALRTTLADAPPGVPDQARIRAELADLDRRKTNLLAQLEEFEPTGDDDIDAELRGRLQHRYNELARQHKTKITELRGIEAAREPRNDPALLEELPRFHVDLVRLPDDLRRKLLDSLRLEIRYRYAQHDIIIRMTIKEEDMPTIHALGRQIADPPNGEPANGRSSLPLCAPCKIRTCAPASGGRCSIP